MNAELVVADEAYGYLVLWRHLKIGVLIQAEAVFILSDIDELEKL